MTERQRPIRSAGGALLVCSLLACAPEEAPAIDETLVADPVPQVAVRGRLEGGPRLRLALDLEGCPVPPERFVASVDAAVESWNATGLAELERVTAEGEPDARLSWHRGKHGACMAFGHDSSVAHAGPLAIPSFVHLDAARDWSEEPGGLPLDQVVLHEVGHLLGLDHVTDPAAVMHANYDRRRAVPATSDLAGLGSLYGGLEDGPGDVYARLESGGELQPLLRRAAPVGQTGVAAWDVDHDGRDELLLWRTDPAGHGRLTAFHFGRAMELDRSEGPMVGCVVPGARVVFGTDAEGQGMLVSVLESGHYYARRFTQGALPEVLHEDLPLGVETEWGLVLLDEDTDGVLDEMPADWGTETASGDLDGDGELEEIVVR